MFFFFMMLNIMGCIIFNGCLIVYNKRLMYNLFNKNFVIIFYVLSVKYLKIE